MTDRHIFSENRLDKKRYVLSYLKPIDPTPQGKEKNMTDTLTRQILTDAVSGQIAAFCIVTPLMPAGGHGHKVFPPTYLEGEITVGGQTIHTKYSMEIAGDKLCVLLDSTASQANRMEDALQDAWDDEKIGFPLLRVCFRDLPPDDSDDFGDIDDDLSRINGNGYRTALQASHRYADGGFRDSMIGDDMFRVSETGLRVTHASPKNAGPLYGICPHALVFGAWDSIGPKGSFGAKFERILESEIKAIGVTLGMTVSSKLDDMNIKSEQKAYKANNDLLDKGYLWTLDEEHAAIDKGKKKPEKKNPADFGHGNIPPVRTDVAGGITFEKAEQRSLVSLNALRKLRFPRGVDDKLIEDAEMRKEGEIAARTVIAALALAAIALQQEAGYHLRSRCSLVPDPGPDPDKPSHEFQTVEMIGRDGKPAGSFVLRGDDAIKLYEDCCTHAETYGFGLEHKAIDLTPSPNYARIIRESRRAAGREDMADKGDKEAKGEMK